MVECIIIPLFHPRFASGSLLLRRSLSPSHCQLSEAHNVLIFGWLIKSVCIAVEP